jgi:secreted trypsin-like serine protease
MVGIVRRGSVPAQVFCGGAIIHYYFILSAAHCFPKAMKESDIYVRVGDHDQYTAGLIFP